jgi:uncharacterized protein (DUF983 family)
MARRRIECRQGRQWRKFARHALTCEFCSHIVDHYSFVDGDASSQSVAME